MKTKTPYILFGIICILGAGAFPHPALAYFTGTSEATGATVSAGTLAFTLDTSTYAASISAGSSVTAPTATMTNTGIIDFQYKTDVENIVCDPTFDASTLSVTATRDGISVYSGSLSGFASTTVESSGSWSFQFSLAAGSTADMGAKCSFDIAFSAWQAGMPAPSAGGFTAAHSMHVTLTDPPPSDPPTDPPTDPPADSSGDSSDTSTPADTPVASTDTTTTVAPVVTSVSPPADTDPAGDTAVDSGTAPATTDVTVVNDTSVAASAPASDPPPPPPATTP